MCDRDGQAEDRNPARFDSKLLSEYAEFLRNHQGLAESTIGIRRRYVSPFLAAIEDENGKIGSLSPEAIHEYVIKTRNVKTLTRSCRKQLSSSLRSFLRFAHFKGYVDRDLRGAVPVIKEYRLARVPRSISWESAQKLLEAPDRNTRPGRRDYAILQLLATYGVRIGQILSLELGDIDWHRGIINFRQSKGGKPLSLPLKLEVADAILTYLREDRGDATYPEVFLTVRGEPRPLGKKNWLGSSLQVYYRRAGIECGIRCSSHAIRHAFATRLLEQGTPIKTISDLLGHRCIGTTFIYTKVNMEQLRSLSREWPEVTS